MQEEPPWALITGAGSGIGAAVAVELSRRGCRTVLVGRRAEVLEATRVTLADPEAAVCIPCDIGGTDERERLEATVAERIAATGGDAAYLVHSAAIGEPSPDFAGTSPAELERALAVNTVAPLALTQAWQRQKRATGTRARILLVGTGVADHPQPGTGAYGISKKAMHRLFDQMVTDFDAEADPCAPRVGLFRPGVVDTEGLREHCRFARTCGLPHVDYLEGVLTAGEAWNPEAVGRAMSHALLDASDQDFHGQVLRTAEWSV
jgi:NAD(P)-dependent dehydrogenase (short-subunit alcohol dehydrogenase family)